MRIHQKPGQDPDKSHCSRWALDTYGLSQTISGALGHFFSVAGLETNGSMRGENFQKLGELVIYSLLSKTHFVETYFKKTVQPLDCCGFSWIKNNIEHTQMPTRFQQPFFGPMLNIQVPHSAEFSGPCCCALVVSKRIQLQNGAPQSQVGLNPIISGYIPWTIYKWAIFHGYVK